MDGPDPKAERGLEAAWARLEGLIDWERRERQPGKRGQAMRVDLEPIRDLCRRCGDPQAGRRFVHVSGTKGKGSVAALVAAGMAAGGLRVLRYGSPHVERLHERISLYEVGGMRAVADAELALALHAALDARDGALADRAGDPEGEHPAAEATWFDVLTCAALVVMRDLEIAWGVFECGLGGRLDSTNVIDGEVCVLTNVDLEHTEVLGHTRAAIAGEKVAIVGAGATLVTGASPDDGEVAPVIGWHVDEVARGRVVWALADGARRTILESNVALAGAALEALGLEARLLEPSVVAAAALPGRMEVRQWEGLTVVLDGAHVASSLARVLDELGLRAGLERPPVVILGLGKDKDCEGLLKLLGARVDRLVCTSVGSQTAVPPEALVENARRFVVGAQSASTPRIALDQARGLCSGDDWLLVTGSLHLVGAVRPLLGAPSPAIPEC